uniref:Uncharacterized protein n=1 Tax=Plectus sambesii TaxID=2011161 RepID=A0A914UM53_9BILA
MLLNLAIASLVIIALASEALGATFNCASAEQEIRRCLHKPEQNKTLTQYRGYLVLYKMPKVTTILKNLKTSGCIKESEWTNIQAWIKINTPPKAYIAIYKNLSKAHKKIWREVANWDYANGFDQEMLEKYEIVKNIHNDKLQSLPEDDKKKHDEWFDKYVEACLQ